MADPYAVLGVPPSATQEDISQAYRRLAQIYHPDISTERGAAERMREINSAYSLLSNPVKRAEYDVARSTSSTAPTNGAGYHLYRTPQPHRSRPSSAASSPAEPRSGGATRFVGLVALAIAVVFVAGACVLSLRVPTTTGPDGIPILPRATATALAIEGQSPAQRTAIAATQTARLSANANVSATIRNHPVLRTFSHPVLVPPASAAPFDALGSEPTRISGTSCDNDPVCVPRYVIDYGDQARSGAEVSGYAGRALFDSDLAAATAACHEAVGVCNAPLVTGRPEVQYIREFEVRGAPATARQQACCPGPFLSLTWYDAATDTTYRLQLSMQAARLGADSASSDLGGSANKLADLAGALIPLR